MSTFELPENLKTLYKHWDKHTVPPEPREKPIQSALLDEILQFVTERMNIWSKKQAGKEPPFTDDPILQNYRFCNVYRELDRQTITIHESLKPFLGDFELWLLNLAFQRFVVKPETVKQVGFLKFDKEYNKSVYRRLLELDSPKYGSAYIFPISVIQKTKYNTREKFFTLYLPKVMREVANIISGFENVTVNKALSQILPTFGFNFYFHWTEILIDVAYQHPAKIDLLQDFYIGPGAKPTLQRFGKGFQIENLVRMQIDDIPLLTFNGKSVYLSAENWEGIFCEFRKYTNLKAGKGRKRCYR